MPSSLSDSLVVRARRTIGASLALAWLLSVVACEPASQPVIRVGLIGVFTGTLATASGVPGRLGAQLAVDEINAAGGVDLGGVRHRVVLFEREIDNRPDAAAVAARSLINLDSIDVLLGPQTSSLAIAAAPVAEESQVVMIAPMASNPAVTSGRRLVFRLAFLDDFQGEVIARFAADSLGLRSAAALHDAASPYGQNITELFTRTFTARGGRVVRVETFDSDGPRDYAPQLRRILAARPEALLLPNFVTADSSQIYQARAMGFRGVFLGTDSWDVRGLSPREAALGALVVANWDRRSDRPAAAAFIARWTARHGDVPIATSAATYDAVHLAMLAMQRAGVRGGPAMADSLRTFGRYVGAITDYEFRGSQDPRRGAVILEVTPSELRVRATIPAAP